MQLRRIMVFLGVAGVTVLLSLGVYPLFGQQRPQAGQQFPAAYRAPRLADGHPDLNGIWQALVTANWDLQDHEAQAGPHPELSGAYAAGPAGQSIIEGGEIPYKPDALAKKKANFENRLKVDVSSDKTWHELGDPEMKCYMPGVPRVTYMPFPFQIVQFSDRIVILYEYLHATREIYMDGSPHSELALDSGMGDSRGRWEGNTLVVDVTSFNDRTWFDRVGNFHSDQLHVVERYTRVGADQIMYEATIEDPKVFTRPWKMRMPLYRRTEPNAQILEFECYAYARDSGEAGSR
jgi:hypothetical protein